MYNSPTTDNTRGKYSEIVNYMKPIKNKVFCKNCGRTKMLFDTEKKAENFIKFNKEEIETESGYGPKAHSKTEPI